MKNSMREVLQHRVLLLDGGMGSMLQQAGLRGNNDAFVLSHPEVIQDIHRQYLEAGADIITTDTFSSQRVSQQEYGLTDCIDQLNRTAARLARQVADEYTRRDPEHPRYVVGDVGPTSKMLSMSENVDDPAARSISFDEMEVAYLEQIRPLVEEGVDAILIETIFDTLNAKAAISAYLKIKDEWLQANADYPELMLSMTVSDASGRVLSGQTVEAFVTSVMHANPLSVGLNCGLGADGILPWLRQMSACAPCYVSCHPNAGLPNQDGGYDDTPADMLQKMQPFFAERLVNIVGGCCGTTPAHIAAMRSQLDAQVQVRPLPVLPQGLRLAGLESFYFAAPCISAEQGNTGQFVRVGERCNVAGSRKFLRLISEKKYDDALDIARKQVEDGAQVIDVNMDDGLLDAKAEMQTFLNLMASDPSIARVPVMVDSSRFEVIEAGLKCLQGKGVVNSISLKMGEAEFVEHARTVKRLGAAVIDMCFDEEGQATDYERRVRICQRGFELLTQQCGFAPSDIIFDPNVLTVATGMAEHNAYASDFIRATRWVADHLQGTRVSGGLSNLSFAFRGNNYLREAMHTVFLHHAIPNGMGMAIMNPAAEIAYDTIPAELRLAISEVVLNTSPEAPEALMALAGRMNAAKEEGLDPLSIFQSAASAAAGDRPAAQASAAAPATPEDVLKQCLLKGITAGLDDNLKLLIERGDKPVDIISGPLMDGMNAVGKLFGEGKMFLPQVVKTARTMKRAVEYLQPYMEQASDANVSALGRVVLATVKGDVHDIGKNIVGVVLACNNFEVIDLGVMVPTDDIVQAAIEHKADFVCLSGLITPSLEEMCHVATAMKQAGLSIPILVGGATTSDKHTAVKIAPCYHPGLVFRISDAAQNPVVCMKLLDPRQREGVIADNLKYQQSLAAGVAPAPVSAPDTTESKVASVPAVASPSLSDATVGIVPLSDCQIDWNYFFWAWRTKADTEVGKELKADAERLLAALAAEGDKYAPRYVQTFYPASGKPEQNCIEVRLRHNDHDPDCPCCNQMVIIPTPRQTLQSPAIVQAIGQGQEYRLKSLSDYVDGQIGCFATTMSPAFVERLEQLKAQEGGGDYDVLLLQTLGDRLAEAAAEYLSQRLEREHQWRGIRPAVGYPSLPDQKTIFTLARLVDFDAVGIRLTENGAMYPQASTCGLYIGHPDAEYFTI